MFPGAKFIFIHRDPFLSIPSTKLIWKLNRAFSFEEYSEDEVEDILISQYQAFYGLFKAQSGSDICHEVSFEQLITDSAGTMEIIYKNLGLEGWEEDRPKIASIQAKRKKIAAIRFEGQIPAFLKKSDRILEIRSELGYRE
jgi:hypothetical protein